MLRTASLLAIVLMVFGGIAHADEESGLTFGVGITRNSFDLNADATSGLGGSDDSTGFNVFAGWRFNRYLSLEAIYLDAGDVEREVQDITINLDGKGYGASLMGTLPIAESFAVYARAGMMRGELDARASGPGGSIRFKTSDEEFWYGAGIWGLLDGAQVRLEYTKADFELVDTDQLSLSIAWMF
jgi:outer membrane immunogenic protein